MRERKRERSGVLSAVSSYGVKMGARPCVVLVVMVVVATVRWGQAFNVLPVGLRSFSGPPGSQFGFSVALWKDVKNVKRVVVGAPSGNQTWANITFPLGAAYLCEPHLGTTDDDDDQGGGGGGACHVQPNLTPENDSIYTRRLLSFYRYTLEHYGMALGQTLVAEKGEGTKMMVCSPRYPEYFRDNYIVNNGMCYVMQDPTDVAAVKPPYNKAFKTSLTGYSVASTEDNIVMGGPMAIHGCGLVINCVRGRCGPFTTKFETGNTDKETISKKKACSDTYQGWAVQLARFGGPSNPLTIAASSPKTRNYKGQISFFPVQMKSWQDPLHVIEGEETGVLFGYALASPDLDGDGAADLVIGAPLASNTTQKLYDAGKVLIYYAPLADDGWNRPQQHILWGRYSKGRFGTSLASLGDINGDHYQDVAVGAPYAGEDGSGLVYIYNGGMQGLKPGDPKLITPSEFFPGARGFGFSLDGDQDMDGNKYPDMVIGAVHSNSALLVRASPVLKLEGSVTFRPSIIDIKKNLCKIEQAGQKMMRGVCFDVRVDLTYSSLATFSELILEYELKMTTGSNSSMLYGFTHNTDRTTKAERSTFTNKRSPWSLRTFVQRSRDNKNLAVSVTVAVTRVVSFKPKGLTPILDIFTPTSFDVSSQVVCEDESGCSTEPDLVLNAFGSPVIMVDGPVPINLNVSVEVKGDPAYGIKVEVNYPEDITYKDVDAQGFIPACRKTKPGKEEITCFIEEGKADEKIDFWLSFEHAEEKDPDLLLEGTTFSLTVTNDVKNSDPDPSNNAVRVTIPTKTKATLYPQSISEPEGVVVIVNETASQEDIDAAKTGSATFPVDSLGPRVDHVFFLNNRGPSPIHDATLLFQVPLYVQDAPLAYFVVQPTTSHGVKCNYMNTNELKLQPPRSPVTFASPSSSPSIHEMETKVQHGREKRDVEESTPPVTTSSSTSPLDSSTSPLDSSTPPFDSSTYSSTFQWTTDPAEYFSTTYDPIQSRQSESDSVVECTRPECLVTCFVPRIPAGESVKVNFSSYLVIATLNKLGRRVLLVRTSITPNVTQEGSIVINPTLAATVEVILEKPLDKDWFSVLPLWLIILAVVLAFLFILIIIFGLWKGGFFKRNRPPAEYDRQSFVQEKQITIESLQIEQE